jgi:hypothetical protein
MNERPSLLINPTGFSASTSAWAQEGNSAPLDDKIVSPLVNGIERVAGYRKGVAVQGDRFSILLANRDWLSRRRDDPGATLARI